jgi:ATP dependent DNA ligase-like protein
MGPPQCYNTAVLMFTQFMLLSKADAMLSSPDWTYEPKWDGFRVLASIRDGHVRLISRNGHSFTTSSSPVSDALPADAIRHTSCAASLVSIKGGGKQRAKSRNSNRDWSIGRHR